MATPTFSSTPSVLSPCDTMTGWTGNSGEPDAELKKEGAASLVFIFATNGNNDAYFDPAAPVDLSNKHLRLWYLSTNYVNMDIKANGGLQFFVSDGSNTGYWYLHGKDTYAGGWILLTIDTARSVDSGVKPTMTAVTRIGIRVATTSKPKTADNTWIDLLCYGDGYTITGGSDGDKITWQDIADTDVDTTEGWGIVQKINGVYFVNGKLIFGDGSGTASCYFADTGETVVFLDEPVNANLYEIKIEGNGTGTTKFQLGAKSGARGISGCLIRAAGTQDFDITSTDTDIDELKLYGCTFLNADSIQLPPNASGREVIDCAFEVCGEVLPDTCVVQYCNFINADDLGVRMSSTSHNIVDCNFINCGHGVHVPSEGAYTFSNLKFSGCTFDIENSVSATEVDSYADTNGDTAVQLYSGSKTRLSQSFVAAAGKLSRAIFSLQRVGTPTGSVVAKLYADSGGSGPSTLLATSEVVDIAGIGTSWAQVDFEFEDEYTLVVSTTYWISVEYVGGGAANRLEVEVDSSAPGHSGSCYSYTGSWSSETYDMCFYVNRDGIVTVNATNGADPGITDETAATKGATIISNTKTLTVTTKNTSGLAIPSVNVRIEKDPEGTLISEGQTNASGVYTDGTYNYLGDQDVLVVTRKKGLSNNRAFATIEAPGLSVPFTMLRDRSVNLP